MVTLKCSPELTAELEGARIRACEFNNLQLYRISQALLWLGQGRSVAEVASLVNVSVSSVYHWLRCWLSKGTSWLCRHYYQGRGRKAKLTPKQKQQLVEVVKAGPEKAGFSGGVWTTVLIGEWIFSIHSCASRFHLLRKRY